MTYLRTNYARPNALNWPLGLGDIEKQLDTLFAGLPGLFDQQANAPQARQARSAKLRWYEKADAYLVRIDLPGVKKDAVEIELEEGTVTVSAVRRLESKKGDEVSEEAKYAQAFRVPEEVQQDAIAANFEDGVLSLTLPKSEKAQPRQISIG